MRVLTAKGDIYTDISVVILTVVNDRSKQMYYNQGVIIIRIFALGTGLSTLQPSRRALSPSPLMRP